MTIPFNGFGCTYQTIVDAYRGAVVADFGGQTIIENEITLAVEEFVSRMSPKAMSMLQRVEYLEVPQLATISGSNWTPVPALLQDLTVWQVPRYNPALNNSYIYPLETSSCGHNNDCSNIKKELSTQYLFTDYTIDLNKNIIFGSSFDQDVNTYYVSYTVDTSSLILNSIAGMLRDRVACVLGMQLYSKQDDTWGLVTLYCTRGDKWLESIDEHWLPSEYKRYKWLNDPFTIKGGIKTIKMGRA